MTEIWTLRINDRKTDIFESQTCKWLLRVHQLKEQSINQSINLDQIKIDYSLEAKSSSCNDVSR